MSSPTVAELIAEARDNPGWRERRRAVIGLGYRDEEEIRAVLLDALDDPVSDVRHAAIIALGRRGDREVVSELERPKILASEDSRVRWAAVSALGKLGDHRIIDVLVPLVNDPEWLVANEALVVLRMKVAEIIEVRDLRLARVLVRMLNIADPGIVELAKEGLRVLGTDASPMLSEAMESVWEPIRRHAAHVMGTIRDRAVAPALIRALEDESPAVRAEAAEALQRVQVIEALRPLINASTDYDEKVRQKTVTALVSFGATAVDPLCLALEHTRNKLGKCATIEALGEIGDTRAIPVLRRELASGYHVVRNAAVASLTRFGPAVVDPLRRMLSYHCAGIDSLRYDVEHSDDAQTRIRAVKALGNLEDHRAVDLLKSLLSEPDRELALAAQASLEMIGRAAWGRRGAANVLGRVADRRAIPDVVGLLEDDSINARRAGVFALGGLGAVEHADRLAAMARKDSEPRIRRAALSMLRELVPGSPELLDTALEALEDETAQVRVRATRIVAEFPEERAAQPLLARLSDPSWNVRVSAETALCTQGAPVVPGLLEILREGSLVARRRAARALGRIRDPRAAGPLQKVLETEEDAITFALAREALVKLR